MASVNLAGVLLDSLGEIDVGGVMTFTHVTTTGQTIASTKIDLIVPPDGAYNIDVEYGEVRIDYTTRYTENFVTIATVNSDTTATTIPELIGNSVPVSDPIILEMQALIQDAKDSYKNGVLSFTTLALLTAFTPVDAEQELSSFKVTNDPDPTLNGYYHWVSAGVYAKDSSLVDNVINPDNSSDGVSGSAVAGYVDAKNNKIYTKDVDLGTLAVDLYIKADGSTASRPGSRSSGRLALDYNAGDSLLYDGQYGALAIGLLFRNIDGTIISSTSQGSIGNVKEVVLIPAGTYTVEFSSTSLSLTLLSYATSFAQDFTDLNTSVNSLLNVLEIGALTAGVYLNVNNDDVSLVGAAAYGKVSVAGGRQISVYTRWGNAAVGVIFFDELDDIISATTRVGVVTNTEIVDVPANAKTFRVSTLLDTPIVAYVSAVAGNSVLSGRSWDAIGDSITEGSSIRSNEGITKAEAQLLVYCGLIGSRNGMNVINNGKAGTRVAAFNPYGRTVGYYDGGVLIGYEEIHYLAANTAADGKVFTTPAGCDSIRLTIAFTDAADTNNSIANISATLKMVIGDNLTGTNLYASGHNVAGSYIKYDGSLIADASGIYVDIPVAALTQYAISDLYEFASVGAFRYNSFVERKANFVANQTDFKLIMGGTNDRNDYVIGANNSLSPYEFKGAYNIIIKNILDTFPQTRLGLATIMRFNTETYIDELAQATIDMGDLWSMPVIDMRKNSGINVTLVDDITPTNYDSIHPNLAGNITLSYKLESFLSSI